MVRFVALGDSLTEGTGDPHPLCPNGLRGWADIFAAGLGAADQSATYANLAIHGRRSHEVRDDQLPAALTLQPSLVSVWAGGNDLLRPRVHTPSVMDAIEATIASLRASGAEVLVLTGMQPPRLPVMRVIGGRVQSLNEALRATARAHGALTVDVSDRHEWSSPLLWADDRVHPSAGGHARIAECVAQAAGLSDVAAWVRAHRCLIAPELRRPTGWRQRADQEVRWWAKEVVPHVGRWATNASAREESAPKWPEPVSPSARFDWVAS